MSTLTLQKQSYFDSLRDEGCSTDSKVCNPPALISQNWCIFDTGGMSAYRNPHEISYPPVQPDLWKQIMLGHTWECLISPASGRRTNRQPRQTDEVGQSISSWHEVSFNQQLSCLLDLALAVRTRDRANFKAGGCYWDSISEIFRNFSIKNHFRQVSQTSQWEFKKEEGLNVRK